MLPSGVSRIARNVPSRDSAYSSRAAKPRQKYVCRLVGSILLPDARQPTGMPAAFTGEEIPCRPKGRPAFRGGPRNRDFSRKKRCYPAYVLAASEIARRQFRRRGSHEQQIPPAGRPRTFAPDRSALFMGHSVQALSAPARPADAGNVIGQLAAPAQSRRPESAGLRA